MEGEEEIIAVGEVVRLEEGTMGEEDVEIRGGGWCRWARWEECMGEAETYDRRSV